ncbi:somatomedin-B and thrombospondin type-1 domain-containing protein-like [Branchiostoma floridae]|uniref:Somatomedin-B and thrombospondin type-1 domain-containing protein-like n=1 Tax=Branchiostoma floridae TaxID=7739 RepID=A0A9J7N3Z7_BRAFL|nr:somatomedin-B and thrombospondin type-1 domain-containing protein-like [Branchiostoma floridae]
MEMFPHRGVVVAAVVVLWVCLCGVRYVHGDCRDRPEPQCCTGRDAFCHNYGLRTDNRYGPCYCDEACTAQQDCCQDYTWICIPVDCEVGEWSGWSACTSSCDIGFAERRRRVTKEPKNGGKACPPEVERRGCYEWDARKCDPATDVALLTPAEFSRDQYPDFRPKRVINTRNSYCVFFYMNEVPTTCILHRQAGQWTHALQPRSTVCVECQPAAMDRNGRCSGDGVDDASTLWKAMGVTGCQGSWLRAEKREDCNCGDRPGTDFLFV